MCVMRPTELIEMSFKAGYAYIMCAFIYECICHLVEARAHADAHIKCSIFHQGNYMDDGNSLKKAKPLCRYNGIRKRHQQQN